MAPGTFANSTQRTQCGGAAHAQEGSRRLMKIQLAHFGNGLCKRNEISGPMVGNKSREASAPLDQLYIRLSQRSPAPPLDNGCASPLARLLLTIYLNACGLQLGQKATSSTSERPPCTRPAADHKYTQYTCTD